MVKKKAKEIFYRLYARTSEQILPIIKGKNIISFDVFDTLLKRDVMNPTDVFDLMERDLRERKKLYIHNFADKRREAEQKARIAKPDREITLKDIYGYISCDDDVRKELMEMECQMELALSAPNIPVQQLYEVCLEQRKKILFLSDMYLPSDVVRKLLEKNGYTEGILYVSAESGFTKKSGELFTYVQKKESIDVKRWCHVGDHILSDYLVPKRMRISSCLIDRNPRYNLYVDKKTYRENDQYRQVNHFIDTRLGRYMDPYDQIGYAVLGPLLYGFSEWINREIPENQTILFLAREGALLKKAFEIVSDRHSEYLYISRQAAYTAFLDHVETKEEAINANIRVIKEICTQKEFAQSYGLSEEEVHQIFADDGLDENVLLFGTQKKEYILDKIWPTVKKKVINQYHLLQKYLEQLGVTEKCAVVDVGWRGTIQTALLKSKYKANNKMIQWNGYYMACMKYLRDGLDSINKKGFLFEPNLNKRIQDSVINSVSFFELLFLSTGGTTKAYTLTANGIEPIFGEPENKGNISRIIESIQEKALQFVRDFHESPIGKYITIDANVSVGNYLACARIPSLHTLKLFEDFRAFDGSTYKLMNDHSFWYYLLHPKQFFNEFSKKPGRSWFLKGVFKLPLPYISILNFIRRIFYKD